MKTLDLSLFIGCHTIAVQSVRVRGVGSSSAILTLVNGVVVVQSIVTTILHLLITFLPIVLL